MVYLEVGKFRGQSDQLFLVRLRKKNTYFQKKREKNGKKTGENEGRQLSEHEER